MKNPDEIMAEYLLKGGKMLSKICQTCGSPLFEYNGETVCVVCKEVEKEGVNKVKEEVVAVADSVKIHEEEQGGISPGSGRALLAAELEKTLINLCTRARGESRPEDCLVLMEGILAGTEALKILLK
jgi:UPF0148 protein